MTEGITKKSFILVLLVLVVGLLAAGTVLAEKQNSSGQPSVPTLVTTLEGGATGSTLGPGGALYVAENATGSIWRIDPKTGNATMFASGLPEEIAGIGGVMDVAFIGGTAYALVTLVGPDVGGSDVDGIYRVDGPNSFTVVADIGAYSIANPPNTGFFVPTGVQYAMETFRDGFLVTDGHHNRVLQVTLDGEITEMMAFGNTVPTGLEVHGNTIYMAEAGPVPHLPENGKVVSFGPNSPTVTEVASGARLNVDVEFGYGRTLYALSQGVWTGDQGGEGSPAMANTGELLEVNGDGTVTVITGGLDRPTSFEFISNSAYVVSITGKIWRIDDVSGPPFGASG
jgi:sugar lactone lactonase YvrE